MPVTDVDVPHALSHVSVLDQDGNVDRELEPEIPDEDLVKLYRTMILVRAFDERRLRLQRQGRIGTFAPVKGQEAAQLGSIYALRDTDWMVPAFRETAAAVWRGMPLDKDLLYAAGYDEAIEPPEGSRDLPINIPVASQVPHAVGLAWGRKLRGTDDVAIGYLGDGATSEGDFHEAMNFATVYEIPVILLCQNNQYAISVPRWKQTRSRTIAQKAFAYEMNAVQVDGNDVLAVYRVTRDAVERARNGEGPTFIEAITYRLSVHTTADDPTKYRTQEEVDEWMPRDPVIRFRKYLANKGLLDEDADNGISEDAENAVADAVRKFEEGLGGDALEMFDHAYAENPPYLERQRDELGKHLGERRFFEGGGH